MVNREDDRMDRKGDIETDDVPELLGELRIVRQLERPDTMRRELVASRMSCYAWNEPNSAPAGGPRAQTARTSP